MSMSRSEVLARIKALDYRKMLKYSTVSLIAVPVTQAFLLIGQIGFGWSGLTANTVAVSTMAIPAYVLNRYWVWGKKDKNQFTTEILPFWGMTILGLIVSTFMVAWVEHHFDNPLMVSLANMMGFGMVWVLKFLVLDKMMFGAHRHFPVEEGMEAELEAL